MAEEERILEVTPDFDGKRIDQCLAASFSDCSRSFLQKLLKDGKVSINGKTQKASSKVAAGDAVLVLLPEPEELNVEPENIPDEYRVMDFKVSGEKERKTMNYETFKQEFAEDIKEKLYERGYEDRKSTRLNSSH